MMQMHWKDTINKTTTPIYNRYWEKVGEELREEYKSETYFGIFKIVCLNSKRFNDGTHLFHILLYVPSADTTNCITLAKVRGELFQAKEKAEKMLSCLKETKQIYAV